jgi:hypothetical protein
MATIHTETSRPRATSGRQNPLLRLPAIGDNAAMKAEPPKTDPSKRKRRWFQFSLRTLFTVIFVAQVVCRIGAASSRAGSSA